MVMADEPKKIDVGLQLYSLRVQFPKDVPGTMKKIHDMGITDVEAADFYGLTAEEVRPELGQSRAACERVTFSVDRFFEQHRRDHQGRQDDWRRVHHTAVDPARGPFHRGKCPRGGGQIQ